MFQGNRLTKEQALEKIKAYCSYQERCHKEVKDKLYSFGLYKKDVEEVLANIIENNYLNEERFATHFAGGKFRIKQWGRKKIQYELQQKGISGFLIKIALKEIEERDYISTIEKLALAKWKSLSGQNIFSKHAKTYAYLLQKGFEPSLINKTLAELKAK